MPAGFALRQSYTSRTMGLVVNAEIFSRLQEDLENSVLTVEVYTSYTLSDEYQNQFE